MGIGCQCGQKKEKGKWGSKQGVAFDQDALLCQRNDNETKEKDQAKVPQEGKK